MPIRDLDFDPRKKIDDPTDEIEALGSVSSSILSFFFAVFFSLMLSLYVLIYELLKKCCAQPDSDDSNDIPIPVEFMRASSRVPWSHPNTSHTNRPSQRPQRPHGPPEVPPHALAIEVESQSPPTTPTEAQPLVELPPELATLNPVSPLQQVHAFDAPSSSSAVVFERQAEPSSPTESQPLLEPASKRAKRDAPKSKPKRVGGKSKVHPSE